MAAVLFHQKAEQAPQHNCRRDCEPQKNQRFGRQPVPENRPVSQAFKPDAIHVKGNGLKESDDGENDDAETQNSSAHTLRVDWKVVVWRPHASPMLAFNGSCGNREKVAAKTTKPRQALSRLRYPRAVPGPQRWRRKKA